MFEKPAQRKSETEETPEHTNEHYDGLRELSGKTIEVPAKLLDMEGEDDVEVEVSAVTWNDSNGYSIQVIPKSWKEANPDKKFASEAITVSVPNPGALIEKYNE